MHELIKSLLINEPFSATRENFLLAHIFSQLISIRMKYEPVMRVNGFFVWLLDEKVENSFVFFSVEKKNLFLKVKIGKRHIIISHKGKIVLE